MSDETPIPKVVALYRSELNSIMAAVGAAGFVLGLVAALGVQVLTKRYPLTSQPTVVTVPVPVQVECFYPGRKGQLKEGGKRDNQQ